MAINWGTLGQAPQQPGQPGQNQSGGIGWGQIQNIQPMPQVIAQAAPQDDSGGIGSILEGIAGLVGGVKQGMSGKGNLGGQAGGAVSAQQVLGNNQAQQTPFNQSIDLQGPRMNGNNSLYDTASQLLGQREGNPALSSYLQKANPNLDPSQTPWCAGFVGSVLGANGIKGTGSLAAKSYLNFGKPTDAPTRGDIAVFNRTNNPNLGHVGFVDSVDAQRGVVRVLGGNQGNSVSIKEYPLSQVAGFRVPPTGQQVQQFGQQRGLNPAQVSEVPNQINQAAQRSQPQVPFQSRQQAPKQSFPSAGQPSLQSQQPRPNTQGQSQFRPLEFQNPNLDPDVKATLGGIVHVETGRDSGNPYEAQGKPTKKGDRALGYSQIMASNVPSWSREALGYPVTSQQYLASPEIQRQVTEYHVNKLYQKYKDPNVVQSVWFTGRTPEQLKGKNPKDGYGTSNSEYNKVFNKGYLNYRDQFKSEAPGQKLSQNAGIMSLAQNDAGNPSNLPPRLPPIPSPTPTGERINEIEGLQRLLYKTKLMGDNNQGDINQRQLAQMSPSDPRLQQQYRGQIPFDQLSPTEKELLIQRIESGRMTG